MTVFDEESVSNSSTSKKGTPLSELLSNCNEEFRSAVIEYTVATGVRPNDPLFVLLIAVNFVRKLIEQEPQEIERVYASIKEDSHQLLEESIAILEGRIDYFEGQIQSFRDETESLLDKRAKVAVDVNQKAVAESVTKLIRRTQIEKIKGSFWSLVFGGSMALALLGIGGVVGFGAAISVARPKLDPSGPRQLTLEEASALEWAMSDEGRFAKEFMKWNDSLLASSGGDRFCERDAESLPVALTIEGKEAINGFCALWVVPPGNRSFQN